MTTGPFDPLFDQLEGIILADERFAAFDTSEPDWIGHGVPPEQFTGPLPCIRLSGIGNTGFMREGSIYTAVLTIFHVKGETDALTTLAGALNERLRETNNITEMSWVVRNDAGYDRAVFPIAFRL